MELTRVVIFLIMLAVVLAVAFAVYKLTSRAMEKRRKEAERLLETEEGRAAARERPLKLAARRRKWLPLIYTLIAVPIVTNVAATALAIKAIIENGGPVFAPGNAKYLIFVAVTLYLAPMLFRFVKDNKPERGP